MTREEVYEKLNSVFREVFDDASIEINDLTTSNDIEEWDSFEHINLVVAIEDEFGIKIPMGKTIALHNVGEMVDLIIEMVNAAIAYRR